MNARVATAIVLAALLLLGDRPLDARQPALKDVLARAAAYVSAFQEQLSGIVAEETYIQSVEDRTSRVSTLQLRTLRSDLLLVRPVGADRYIEFRDVFEVDGQSVRDREERLTRLFLEPPPGAAGQLRRVIEESSRYNIGNFTRTMNTPVLAVSFLLPAYQRRFTFARRGLEGSGAWIVAFKEREKPTLIRTPEGENLLAEGRFWIDSSSGAVTRSELAVEQKQFKANVHVTYTLEPALGLLVPAEMRELYEAARDQRVHGHAQYGRFRKFQVRVDETIRPVKQ
jgi:hypothetical protein